MLQRHVGPVSLPDIGNGYFLHPIDSGTERGITVIGPDLGAFLARLLAAVTAFADSGSTTDL